MKKLILIFALTLFGTTLVKAQTNKEEQESIKVQLSESSTKNDVRILTTLPLECWYISTAKSFLFNSFSIISNVEVTIENLTTGELIQEEYPVIAGQVSIPAISTKGTFVIELIINDNEVYIGELKL